MLARHGRFDAPYFPLLQMFIGAFSLIMAVFILITENRQGTIAEKRAQLTLQLSLANEERAAIEKMEDAESEAKERAKRG